MPYKVTEYRFKHRIDTYDEWCKSKDKLFVGELAIVSVPLGAIHPLTGKETETAIYLIKVGDGEHVFEDLPWLESSANIELYGDGTDSQNYTVTDATIYERMNESVPSVRFVQQAVETAEARAKSYTESYSFNEDDIIKPVEEADDDTIIAYGKEAPDTHSNFKGKLYLKEIPEKPDEVDYVVENKLEGMWRITKWKSGRVELLGSKTVDGATVTEQFSDEIEIILPLELSISDPIAYSVHITPVCDSDYPLHIQIIRRTENAFNYKVISDDQVQGAVRFCIEIKGVEI